MSKAKIEIINARELDPTKKYMVMIPSTAMSREDAHNLLILMGKEGIRGLGVVYGGEVMPTIEELPTPEVLHE